MPTFGMFWLNSCLCFVRWQFYIICIISFELYHLCFVFCVLYFVFCILYFVFCILYFFTWILPPTSDSSYFSILFPRFFPLTSHSSFLIPHSFFLTSYLYFNTLITILATEIKIDKAEIVSVSEAPILEVLDLAPLGSTYTTSFCSK